jgi:hypothetical protein
MNTTPTQQRLFCLKFLIFAHASCNNIININAYDDTCTRLLYLYMIFPNISDKLEKACRVTAQTIEKEWIPLYRMLPFHPPRAEENLRV